MGPMTHMTHLCTSPTVSLTVSIRVFLNIFVEEYFGDLIKAYREEIVELYYLGCRNIQFDEPNFALFCADSMIAGMKEAGIDPEAQLNMYIWVYNEILKKRPADLSVTIHTCRGNYMVGHLST